jgi:hypothetical protein
MNNVTSYSFRIAFSYTLIIYRSIPSGNKFIAHHNLCPPSITIQDLLLFHGFSIQTGLDLSGLFNHFLVVSSKNTFLSSGVFPSTFLPLKYSTPVCIDFAHLLSLSVIVFLDRNG